MPHTSERWRYARRWNGQLTSTMSSSGEAHQRGWPAGRCAHSGVDLRRPGRGDGTVLGRPASPLVNGAAVERLLELLTQALRRSQISRLLNTVADDVAYIGGKIEA